MSQPGSALPLGPVFTWYREHQGLIYTAGHAAVDVDDLKLDPGPFEHEARKTLENLQRTIERAGSNMDSVLKVTVYLTDMGDFRAFNTIYAQFFRGPVVPARTCIEVSRLPYNFRVEVEAVAAVAAV